MIFVVTSPSVTYPFGGTALHTIRSSFFEVKTRRKETAGWQSFLSTSIPPKGGLFVTVAISPTFTKSFDVFDLQIYNSLPVRVLTPSITSVFKLHTS